MKLHFRMRLVPLLATVMLVALGIALAQWQTRRAAEKEHILQQILQRGAEAPLVLDGQRLQGQQLAYRKVLLRGEFRRDWPLYLDNRPLHGVAGFYVLMPFKLQGSEMYVLVARGWIPRDPLVRTRLPVLVTPSGAVEVQGVVREQLDRVMQLGAATSLKPGDIVQNLSPADLAKQLQVTMQDFVVEQTSTSPDSLQRDWPLPSSGADRNRGYAFQWYALSAMALIFFVVTGFRRGKQAS
jgi:cytochrome oxidase assembly protein ShyY1